MELDVLLQSRKVSSDGDLDVFVDMPQDKLVQELSKVLKPPPWKFIHQDLNHERQKNIAETYWY